MLSVSFHSENKKRETRKNVKPTVMELVMRFQRPKCASGARACASFLFVEHFKRRSHSALSLPPLSRLSPRDIIFHTTLDPFYGCISGGNAVRLPFTYPRGSALLCARLNTKRTRSQPRV